LDAPFDTLRIDPRSELSIVGQIRGQLVLLVADGRIGPGTRLPAVRSLAAHLGVNANTARAAYARLEAEGIVETRHGVGTTVLDAGDAAMAGVPGWMTNMVGAVIAGLDPFYLDLLRGIEDQADAAGTMLVIVDGRDSPDRAEAAVRQLAARGARGLIAVSVPASPPGGTHPLPTVSVDIPDAAGDSLVFDAEAAAVDAIGHLIAHGHRRIGYVTCPVDWSNQRELYHGYRRALADAALPVDPSLVATVDGFDLEAGRTGARQLLDASDPPTAIFATGGVLAVGVLAEARRRMRVPDDLAIAGYGDVELARLADPGVTMVSLPTRDIGAQAMAALQRRLGDPGADRVRVTLPGRLIPRDSCGPHVA
jgi:LacI family transcriptional regulator